MCKALYITVISKEIDVKIVEKDELSKGGKIPRGKRLAKGKIYKGDYISSNRINSKKKIVLGLIL